MMLGTESDQQHKLVSGFCCLVISLCLVELQVIQLVEGVQQQKLDSLGAAAYQRVEHQIAGDIGKLQQEWQYNTSQLVK